MFIQLWLRYLLKRKDSLNTWSLYILQIQRIIPERWKKDDAHLLGYINAEQNAGIVFFIELLILLTILNNFRY